MSTPLVFGARVNRWTPEKVTGFLSGYAIFTIMLFLVLQGSGHIPKSWTTLHMMPLSATVAAAGSLVRRVLR